MHLRHPVTRAHSSVHQCAPLNAPHMYPALKPIYFYIYMYRPKYAPHIRIALKPIYTYICRRTCNLRHPMHLGHPVACARFCFSSILHWRVQFEALCLRHTTKQCVSPSRYSFGNDYIHIPVGICIYMLALGP